jgi:hypothetical protein
MEFLVGHLVPNAQTTNTHVNIPVNAETTNTHLYAMRKLRSK